MSYPMSMDDYPDAALETEISRRRIERSKGNCDYCFKKLGSKPVCKEAERHALPSPLPNPYRGRWSKDEIGGRDHRGVILRFFEYTDQRQGRGVGACVNGRWGLYLPEDCSYVVLDGAPLNVFTDDQQRAVAAFMVAMGQEIAERPRVIADEKTLKLRIELVREEFEELVRAATGMDAKVVLRDYGNQDDGSKPDLVQTADAMCDLLYVLLGWACAAGIDLAPLFARVHTANMLKTTGPVREDGKRLKPPGWQPPDIEGGLREQGWRP